MSTKTKCGDNGDVSSLAQKTWEPNVLEIKNKKANQTTLYPAPSKKINNPTKAKMIQYKSEKESETLLDVTTKRRACGFCQSFDHWTLKCPKAGKVPVPTSLPTEIINEFLRNQKQIKETKNPDQNMVVHDVRSACNHDKILVNTSSNISPPSLLLTSHTVRISNLPPFLTKFKFFSLCKFYGIIKLCVLGTMRNEVGRPISCNGTGYIEYSTIAQAENCIAQLSHAVYSGYHLEVSFARQKFLPSSKDPYITFRSEKYVFNF
jgi:hypothetical protein